MVAAAFLTVSTFELQKKCLHTDTFPVSSVMTVVRTTPEKEWPHKWMTYFYLYCQLHIELTGEEPQSSTIPRIIQGKLRHLSASYFRAGDGRTKLYHQDLGSYRQVPFNRFAITDVQACRETEESGTSKSPNEENMKY